MDDIGITPVEMTGKSALFRYHPFSATSPIQRGEIPELTDIAGPRVMFLYQLPAISVSSGISPLWIGDVAENG
jgi:hypothetical protein